MPNPLPIDDLLARLTIAPLSCCLNLATRWQAEGPLVRIHIGLEDPQDLIADLAQGLDKLRAAAAQ